MKKLLIVGAALAASLSASAELCVTNGQSVAFMGDSITAFGNYPAGYVNLVMKGLEVAGVKNARKYPAGISGHKSTQMNARLENDVLRKKPDFMTFSCGVNDVWHGANGVPLEKYKELVSDIFNRCAAANVKVIVLTATMIGEDPSNANNQKLVGYNEFLRAEAKRRNLPLADLNADMQAELAEIKKTDKTPGNKLTGDGVHMAFPGNCMMAWGVLKAMGIDPALKDKVYAAWRKIPGAYELRVQFSADEWAAAQPKLNLAGNKNAWINQLIDEAPLPKLCGNKSDKYQWALFSQTKALSFKASNNLTMPYRLYEPKAQNGKLPLVILLHGSGERGSGNDAQCCHGVPELINYSLRKSKPFFVMAPQCPSLKHETDPQGVKWAQLDWGYPGVQQMPEKPSIAMVALMELVDSYRQDPRIDASRIYVTGLSMGGYGTWDLACRHPDWFAAVMPLCGGCDEKAILVLKDTPVKIVHGDNDGSVPCVRATRAYSALIEAGSAKASLVIYPRVSHNCWDRTYGNDEILDWLLDQHK